MREGPLERLPVIGRIADAKAGGDLAGEPAALQVFDGARRFLQLAAIEVHRLFHEPVEVGLALPPGRLLRARRLPLRHLHAHRRGELLHGVDVAERRVRHQESDGVAMSLAPEAVVELLGRADGERRRLFVMERAQAEVVSAALLELDVARDDVDDVDAIEQVLLERIRNHLFGLPTIFPRKPALCRFF